LSPYFLHPERKQPNSTLVYTTTFYRQWTSLARPPVDWDHHCFLTLTFQLKRKIVYPSIKRLPRAPNLDGH
jgi:hypothetical protein